MKSASEWPKKLLDGLKKYKYAAIVVLIGLALLLIPGKSSQQETAVAPEPVRDTRPMLPRWRRG